MSQQHIYGTGFKDPGIQKFLDDFYKIMTSEALVGGEDPNGRVCNFKQPAELESLLDLEITRNPVPHDKLLEICSEIIKHSVQTGHPRFYNLSSGKDAYSITGAWLTDALNTKLHTYEAGPVFVVLEKYIMKKLSQSFGFPEGDGVFCPGGSYSNMLALHVSRYQFNKTVKQQGMRGYKPFKVFTNVDGHFSLAKGANFLGFGTDNVVQIANDDIGQMNPEELDKAITNEKSKGCVPLYVMATCGSTVLGSFDDLNAVADVCKKHGLWMHVDAAWGGSVMFSEKHKFLMKGVERADSVAWNAHKMSGVPIQCSVLIMREKGMLEDCNAYRAEYLFQPDKNYDTTYDIGDKTIQCGRKADVLKLWLSWKAIGDQGLADRVDKAYENAKYLTEKIGRSEGFRLVIPKFQCTSICFWYIPARLRGKAETKEWWTEVSKVAPTVKSQLMEQGTMMIGFSPLSSKGFVNFFRVVVENPLIERQELDFVVEEIDRLGKNL